MARSNELTPALRERICELHAIGWGYGRVHKRYPWIPLSTTRYTIKKEQERRNGVSKPRSGRPKKLTEDDKNQILESIHGNPRTTHEDLLAKVDHKVKLRSIQRLLNAENLRKWRCSWRPYLLKRMLQNGSDGQINISTLHLLIGPAFFGPTNVQSSVGLVSVVN